MLTLVGVAGQVGWWFILFYYSLRWYFVTWKLSCVKIPLRGYKLLCFSLRWYFGMWKLSCVKFPLRGYKLFCFFSDWVLSMFGGVKGKIWMVVEYFVLFDPYQWYCGLSKKCGVKNHQTKKKYHLFHQFFVNLIN